MIKESLVSAMDAWLIALIIFLTMLAGIYFGRVISKKFPAPSEIASPSSSVISAMLGLLAFLLAFTFGMSGSRFDARRQVIVDEANAISTAVLRADLYPDEHRNALRNDFRLYLESRIDYYELRRDFPSVLESLKRSDEYGMKLWNYAAQHSRDPGLQVASMQMIVALNQMIDIRTTRKIGELSQVPLSILVMLFALCIAASFFIGYNFGEKKPDWLVVASFCLLTSIVIYITLDLDRPRRGLIQLDTSQQAMIELRELFR
jgi:cellobiose-specific phosphotransferase system component IIC